MSAIDVHARISRSLAETHTRLAAVKGWRGVAGPLVLGVTRALWVGASVGLFAAAGAWHGTGVTRVARDSATQAKGAKPRGGRPVSVRPPRGIGEPVPGTAAACVTTRRAKARRATPSWAEAPDTRATRASATPATPSQPMAPATGATTTGGHMSQPTQQVYPEEATTYAGLTTSLTVALQGIGAQAGAWTDAVDVASSVQLDAQSLGALAAVSDAYEGVTAAMQGALQTLQAQHSAIAEAVQASGGRMADRSFYEGA